MTWRDKYGNPVFRMSPDSAWPLTRDSDRSALADRREAAGPEGREPGSAPAEIAQIKPRLKVVR